MNLSNFLHSLILLLLIWAISGFLSHRTYPKRVTTSLHGLRGTTIQLPRGPRVEMMKKQFVVEELPKIIQYPNPKLREKCRQVGRFDSKLRTLVNVMFSVMFHTKCISLSACQIGIPAQILVMNNVSDPRKFEPLTIINPIVNKYSKETCRIRESCSSLPTLDHEKIVRSKLIHIDYRDEFGTRFQRTFQGLLARIILHELDHFKAKLLFENYDHFQKQKYGVLLKMFEPGSNSGDRD